MSIPWIGIINKGYATRPLDNEFTARAATPSELSGAVVQIVGPKIRHFVKIAACPTNPRRPIDFPVGAEFQFDPESAQRNQKRVELVIGIDIEHQSQRSVGQVKLQKPVGALRQRQ